MGPSQKKLCSLFDMACVSFQVSAQYRSVEFTLEVTKRSLVSVQINKVFQTGFPYSALLIFLSTLAVMVLRL